MPDLQPEINSNPSNNQIEIRSPEVQEILGRTPHWLLRSGITIIFLLVLGFFIGSWFIRYPDILTTRTEITAKNPPVNLVARYSGKLDRLFCADKQLVFPGKVLAVIKNPASFDQVTSLKLWLNNISFYLSEKDTLYNNLDSVIIPGDSIYFLGEIQASYESFVSSLVELNSFKQIGYYPSKINALKIQIEKQKEYFINLNRQDKIVTSQETLAEKQFKRDSLLFKDGVISEQAYEQSRNTYLTAKYASGSSYSSVINAEIQIKQSEQQVLDLEMEENKELENKYIQITTYFKTLINAVENWEYMYVFKANIHSKVSFSHLWSENQNIRTGDIAFTLIPLETNEVIAKAYIPVSGSGKVKLHQRVNIKLANYPYQEFGMIKGEIRSISDSPADSIFIADIVLPDGLITNYGKTIRFSEGLKGSAEIITEDRNLFSRFFNPIKSLFYDRVK